MRISDWRSDVCSSDLNVAVRQWDDLSQVAGEKRRRRDASARDRLHRGAVVDHDLAARGQVEQALGAHPGELAARRLDRQPQYVGDLLASDGQLEPALRSSPASLPRQALGPLYQEGRDLLLPRLAAEQQHPVSLPIQLLEGAA